MSAARSLVVQVDPGPRERVGCPVFLEVPWPAESLVQLTRPDVKRPLPCQLATDGNRVLVWWIVDRLRAGQPQLYKLTLGGRQRRRRARVRVDRLDPQRIHVVAGRRQLGVLNLARRWPLPFWTPLRTTDGHQVIGPPGVPPMGTGEAYPASSGLWLGPVTLFRQMATADYLAPAQWTSGAVFGEVFLYQRWDFTSGDAVLAVKRFRFFDPREGTYAIDVRLELFAAYGPVTIVQPPSDGLLTLALAPQLFGDASRLTTPVSAATPEELLDTATPWVRVAGISGGRWIGVTVMLPLERFPSARWNALPHEHRISVRYADSPGNAGNIRLETGDRFVAEARILIHRGRPDQLRTHDRYADYAFPPAVRILEQSP